MFFRMTLESFQLWFSFWMLTIQTVTVVCFFCFSTATESRQCHSPSSAAAFDPTCAHGFVDLNLIRGIRAWVKEWESKESASTSAQVFVRRASLQ